MGGGQAAELPAAEREMGGVADVSPAAGRTPTGLARRCPAGRPARLHTLIAGIDRDRDAVIASLTLPWNSGVVEGHEDHVNRIKMLKRHMFDRAGFQLLRKRVLLA